MQQLIERNSKSARWLTKGHEKSGGCLTCPRPRSASQAGWVLLAPAGARAAVLVTLASTARVAGRASALGKYGALLLHRSRGCRDDGGEEQGDNADDLHVGWKTREVLGLGRRGLRLLVNLLNGALRV